MSQGKGIGGHHLPSMKSDEWLTPPEILEALGPFDLDPCAAPLPRPWPTAAKHYNREEDGLVLPWEGRVWCNPPYGKIAGKWLNRMALHANGIALIFARTETEMFFREVWEKAYGVLFIEGRLHFHYPDGTRCKNNSGAPSVLVAYDAASSYTLHICSIPGMYIDLDHATGGDSGLPPLRKS